MSPISAIGNAIESIAATSRPTAVGPSTTTRPISSTPPRAGACITKTPVKIDPEKP